jgi:hypothetical protein
MQKNLVAANAAPRSTSGFTLKMTPFPLFLWYLLCRAVTQPPTNKPLKFRSLPKTRIQAALAFSFFQLS